jgi:hypothetical protein
MPTFRYWGAIYQHAGGSRASGLVGIAYAESPDGQIALRQPDRSLVAEYSLTWIKVG